MKSTKENCEEYLRSFHRTVFTDSGRKLCLSIRLGRSSLDHVLNKHKFQDHIQRPGVSWSRSENESSVFCFENVEDIIGAAVMTGAVTNDRRKKQEGRLAIWAHFPAVIGYGVHDRTPRHKILVTLKPVSKENLHGNCTRVVADIITAFPAICFTCKKVPVSRNDASCSQFHFSLGKASRSLACTCKKPYIYRLKRTSGNRDLKIEEIRPENLVPAPATPPPPSTTEIQKAGLYYTEGRTVSFQRRPIAFLPPFCSLQVCTGGDVYHQPMFLLADA